jgi:nicotinate phosphoribosyltransferase
VPGDALPTSDGAAGTPALLVDLYELTMGESYVAQDLAERPATFELFCRRLPPGWGYLLAAGIGEAVTALERLRFTGEELAYLERTGLFGAAFLDRLGRLRFSGEVRALREGTVFSADEPVLEVTAPLLEAQLVETLVLNLVHLPTLIAGKAARCVDAAGGRRLAEFGLRRAHGGQAGLEVARASYLAGFDSTSDVLAGKLYGIPLAGTMAHSYVECFEDELAAFDAFVRSYPDGSTLLIDTYETIEGARRAARVARELAARGGRLGGVRIDSGDLLEVSRSVRAVLDEEGLPAVTIFASGNLDEHELDRLVAGGAPIEGFGVGTRLAVSADAPSLDAVYKLVSFDGRPVLKLSPGKSTLPGPKQVWRLREGDAFARDVVALQEEPGPDGAEPLLERVLADGIRLRDDPLEEARERAAAQRAALAPEHRALDAKPYPVEPSARLAALRDELAAKHRPRG